MRVYFYKLFTRLGNSDPAQNESICRRQITKARTIGFDLIENVVG